MLTTLVDLLLNLKVILLMLLLLNIGSLFIFKGAFRYVKGPIIIFSFLVMAFLIYRLGIYPTLTENIKEAKQAEIKKLGWNYMNHPDKDAAFTKQSDRNYLVYMALFRIAGIQAAFACILSAIGIFLTPEKKLYSGYALGFFMVTVLFFV